MSASDIRDVLGVVPGIDAAPAAKKVKLTSERRVDGMSRELYNLIGDTLPPVVTLKSKFKEKPKFRQRSAKWSKVAFVHGSRKDTLALSHWTRGVQTDQESSGAAGASGQAYRFEGFDKHPDVISYTDAEYTTYLDKPGWSREDTDLLMNLCREYDLRFIVIHDRWTTESQAAEKTIEELKDRYYSIARSLLASRGQSTEGLSYDYGRECQRKAYLEDLSKRTPEQIEEENKLILDARRLEAYAKTLAQQKADLLRLLETPAETGSIEQYMSSGGYAALAQNMLNADKQKHRKRPSEVPTPAAAQSAVKQRYRKLTPREEREHGVTWHEKLSAGVFLRSQKTVVPKQSIATKVQAVMQELGLSPVLTMPTEKTVRKYDQLQHKINILLEAKKYCDKTAESTEVKEE